MPYLRGHYPRARTQSGMCRLPGVAVYVEEQEDTMTHYEWEDTVNRKDAMTDEEVELVLGQAYSTHTEHRAAALHRLRDHDRTQREMIAKLQAALIQQQNEYAEKWAKQDKRITHWIETNNKLKAAMAEKDWEIKQLEAVLATLRSMLQKGRT